MLCWSDRWEKGGEKGVGGDRPGEHGILIGM